MLAILLGGIVRFMPVVMAGFPVNDGGMFYVMVEEFKANHFLLPAFTQYNLARYSLCISALWVLCHGTDFQPVSHSGSGGGPLAAATGQHAFLAGLLSCLAIEILGISSTGCAWRPFSMDLFLNSFGWAIMGGGITRSFGLLFLFLTIAFANRLFTRTSGLHAALTALFGALAFLSHPETGMQAAAACILLWLFRGRSRQTLLWSWAVALGVVALTAPWWGTVLGISRSGPFPVSPADQ